MVSRKALAPKMALTHILDPTFFPGHAASIYLKVDGKDHVIGVFGILHPTVLDKYDLRYDMPAFL